MAVAFKKRPPFIRRSYAVLATVSGGYSPKGHVPMHYSPVRHSTHPKSFLVRLACVKHAASVRSEPGSNSNVENDSNNFLFVL